MSTDVNKEGKMENKSNTILVLLIVMMGLGSYVFAQDTTIKAVSLEQLDGEWINKEYIERLKATKSPLQAKDGITYTSFTIAKENYSYKWLQIYNFHEGVWFNVTGFKPTPEPIMYQIIYEPIYEREPVKRETYIDTLYISEQNLLNELEWAFTQKYGKQKGKELHIPFVRIEPTIQDYVNSIVLAGKYTDENGQAFTFSSTGEANWIDTSFKYFVSLDTYMHLNLQFDSFYDDDKRIMYHFKWLNNKLFIYETYIYPPGMEFKKPRDEPLYILIPE